MEKAQALALGKLILEFSNRIIAMEETNTIPKGCTYVLSPDGCQVTIDGQISDTGVWFRVQELMKGEQVYPNVYTNL